MKAQNESLSLPLRIICGLLLIVIIAITNARPALAPEQPDAQLEPLPQSAPETRFILSESEHQEDTSADAEEMRRAEMLTYLRESSAMDRFGLKTLLCAMDEFMADPNLVPDDALGICLE